MTFLGTFFILSLLLLPVLWLGCVLTDGSSNARAGWVGAFNFVFISVFFNGLHLATTSARSGVVNDIAAAVIVIIVIYTWPRKP